MEPEKISPEFEQEITAINREIAEKRAELERAPDSEAEKALARDTLSKKLVESDAAIEERPATSVETHLNSVDAETAQKVNEIIEKIHEKGLAAAIAEAREESPYILDTFHDTLVEKLYDELVANNRI